MQRQVSIEIFSPTEGIHTELSPSMMTPRSTPNAQNAISAYGVIKKDYGTSLHSSRQVGQLTWDTYTKLLLHCDGTDESTTFTDEIGKTVTANGDAQIDTAQKKFGTGSALFDGTGDYLSLADSDDWDFGTGDFTIDFQVSYAALPSVDDTYYCLFMSDSFADGVAIYLYRQNETTYKLDCYVKGTEAIYTITTPTLDTFYHISLVRASGVITSRINGTATGAGVAATGNITGLTSGITIGANIAAGQLLNGSMDEIRISKGIARWTANFTAPTAAYAADYLPTAPVNLLYEAPFPGNTILEGFTHTGVFKYINSSSWGNDGQVYTGTYTDFWHAAMHNNAMFFTNGVDPLQYKATYNSTGTNEPGALAYATMKAYAVVSFKEHLNAYHTIESGNESYKRIRWTKVGLLGYTASDWSTAGSGFLDLQDSDGQLLTAAKMGEGLTVIYFEGSIHEQRWVGGTDVYRFDKCISGIDIPTRRCVAVADTIHYVLCRDGVYSYSGGSNWLKISGPIDEYFRTLISATTMNTSWIEYIGEEDEVRVYVPEGSATKPDKCWVYKISDNSWFKDARAYNAGGTSTRASNLTIGDLVGTIGAQDWKFGDLVAASGAPIRLLADEAGYISKVDKTVYSIIASGVATAQEFIFDTKDLSANKDTDPLTRKVSFYGDDQSRWIRVNSELKGSGTVTLQYSVDSGQSWTNFPEGAKTLTSNWSMFKWDLDYASQFLRIRFYQNEQNSSIFMRYIKADLVPGSNV